MATKPFSSPSTLQSAWRTHSDADDAKVGVAAPRRNCPRQGNYKGKSAMMNVGYGGIIGILILIGDIWALINILQSSAENGKKLLWVVVVVLLPLVGLILWFFMGPRNRA
ncbi:MAG: PLDc N-terminal domain-containing protein [Dokdonella sp.]